MNPEGIAGLPVPLFAPVDHAVVTWRDFQARSLVCGRTLLLDLKSKAGVERLGDMAGMMLSALLEAAEPNAADAVFAGELIVAVNPRHLWDLGVVLLSPDQPVSFGPQNNISRYFPAAAVASFGGQHSRDLLCIDLHAAAVRLVVA